VIGRHRIEERLASTVAAAWVGDMIAIWIEVDFSHKEKCKKLKT
jgi:hypothetical protein